MHYVAYETAFTKEWWDSKEWWITVHPSRLVYALGRWQRSPYTLWSPSYGLSVIPLVPSVELRYAEEHGGYLDFRSIPLYDSVSEPTISVLIR